MPAERDFIMRLIQMMGQLIARIREMIAQGETETAAELLQAESRQRGVDLEMARVLSGESLVQLLAPGGAASDPTRLILMGEFLHLDALRAQADGDPIARALLGKARLLLATGTAYLTVLGSHLPELEDRIAEIDELLDAVNAPSPTAPTGRRRGS